MLSTVFEGDVSEDSQDKRCSLQNAIVTSRFARQNNYRKREVTDENENTRRHEHEDYLYMTIVTNDVRLARRFCVGRSEIA